MKSLLFYLLEPNYSLWSVIRQILQFLQNTHLIVLHLLLAWRWSYLPRIFSLDLQIDMVIIKPSWSAVRLSNGTSIWHWLKQESFCSWNSSSQCLLPQILFTPVKQNLVTITPKPAKLIVKIWDRRENKDMMLSPLPLVL